MDPNKVDYKKPRCLACGASGLYVVNTTWFGEKNNVS